jgi:hypothetical protein
MGAAVLCGGKARFTQIPTVFFPATAEEYRAIAEDFLIAEEIEIPPEFQRNARRFLYYQLFRSSLPFGEFLDTHPWPGFVRFRSFHWQKLSSDVSPIMRVLVDGIVQGKQFFYPDDGN